MVGWEDPAAARGRNRSTTLPGGDEDRDDAQAHRVGESGEDRGHRSSPIIVDRTVVQRGADFHRPIIH
jgi:hypothetical protein